MELYDIIFNKASIYDMFFFNIKSILIHPNLDGLGLNNENLLNEWKLISKSQHYADFDNSDQQKLNHVYQNNAITHSEFSKIVTITYGKIYVEDGTIKRHLNKIVNEDEYILVATFMDVLNEISKDALQSIPIQQFPILCGINCSNDIAHLIKRFFYHKDKFKEYSIPLILKKALTVKPWESNIIDIGNVWKFNGNQKSTAELISSFLNLKKTTTLIPNQDLSKYYWDNIGINKEDTLNFIALQSATETNNAIQFINTLRPF